MEPTRDELLRNLQGIQIEIKTVIDLQEKYHNLKEKLMAHETSLSTDRFHDITYRVYYAFVVGGLLGTVITSLVLILMYGGGFGCLAIPALSGFILYKKGKKKSSKLRKATEIVLICCLFVYVPVGVPQIIFTPTVVMVSFFIIKPWLKKSEQAVLAVNEDIEEKNAAIDRHNSEIYIQLENVNDQINRHIQQAMGIGGEWFPKDYYFLYAVQFFIDAVRNHRAEGVKEMVNLFEVMEHQRRMEEKQQEIQRTVQQGVKIQAAQMFFSNILQMQQAESLRNIEQKVNSAYWYTYRE